MDIKTDYEHRSTQDLQWLLESMSVSEFLANYWDKACLWAAGRFGRFHELMPWDTLNHLIGLQYLEPWRIKLALDGRELPAESYTRWTGTRRFVDVTSVEKQVRNGASLILVAIEELWPPLKQLVTELEMTLGDRVWVNAYLAFGNANGFGLHWDHHDVFILQIFGSKRWSVFGPPDPHPLGNLTDEQDCDSLISVWEGPLRDGALLYIPRGFPHQASAQQEATLHLTVAIKPRTAIDLVHWLADRLGDDPLFRASLPRNPKGAAQQLLMTELLDRLRMRWAGISIPDFFRDYDERTLERRISNFPVAAQE